MISPPIVSPGCHCPPLQPVVCWGTKAATGGRLGFGRLVLHHVGDLNPSGHKTGAPEAVLQALCDRVNYPMLSCNTSIYFGLFINADFLLLPSCCLRYIVVNPTSSVWRPQPCFGIDRCIWTKHSIPRFSFKFPGNVLNCKLYNFDAIVQLVF